MSIEWQARDYAAFFETLTPTSLPDLAKLCTSDVRFRDPFNDVAGIEAFQGILAGMFRNLENPRFTVDDWALSGRTAYLRWTFTCRPPRARAPWTIVGMSEVHFDEAGMVTAHIDHWDAGEQVYARLPLVGALIRAIRRRLGG